MSRTDLYPVPKSIGEIKRWWVSWEEPVGPGGDYRPISIHVPPAVREWWSAGHGEGYVTLCAVVDAPSEAEAKAAIEEDWRPMHWRFCEEKAPEWRPDQGRFPWN